MRKLFTTLLLAVVLLACEKKPGDLPEPSVTLPAGLTVYGAGVDVDIPTEMVPVAEGIWDFYGEFNAAQNVKVTDDQNKERYSIKVTPPKEGLCRLRVNLKTGTWSLVKINKVSLVVTEGGSGNPDQGVKPPIEAEYQGSGVWTVKNFYVETDYIRYRYVLETDNPDELKYWCATWDNSGSAPSEHTAEYLRVRALGETEYQALKLKENRASWMFTADVYHKLANITLSMNAAIPGQEIAYAAAHKGPKAAFIGDSITWLWCQSSYSKTTSQMVYPLDPQPSWVTISGTTVSIHYHPSFFTNNNYVNVGISGQNTAQMKARYENDVLKKDPCCVVIMAGTNDLAQGYSKQEILNNLKWMAEQAAAKEIKVILCSITPCNDSYSNLNNPKTKGAHIIAVNEMIQDYVRSKGFTYCDYYPALVDEDGLSLKQSYWAYDHLHPNPDAYIVMEGIIKPIIEELIQ